MEGKQESRNRSNDLFFGFGNWSFLIVLVDIYT